MAHSLTSRENIALDLIFAWLGEVRFNRTIDDYIAIASRAPKLAALHAWINERLGKMAAAGYVPYQISSFRKGDLDHRYENFPTSLSIETVRRAWAKSGMRELQLLSQRLTKRPPKL